MAKTKAQKERARSLSGSPTPRPRRGRPEVPPAPATPSRTSTRVPRATTGAMDFIKTTAARRATAAAGANTSGVDASDSVPTKSASVSKKDASAVKKDASASKTKPSAAKTKGANLRKDQAEVEVPMLSGSRMPAVENAAQAQVPQASNGMRLRSRDKPAAPAASAGMEMPPPNSSKRPQEETSHVLPVDTSYRAPTPVTALRVEGVGDLLTDTSGTEGSSTQKPKPKPKPMRRGDAATDGVSILKTSHRRDTPQPHVSDVGIRLDDVDNASEAGQQVAVADLRVGNHAMATLGSELIATHKHVEAMNTLLLPGSAIASVDSSDVADGTLSLGHADVLRGEDTSVAVQEDIEYSRRRAIPSGVAPRYSQPEGGPHAALHHPPDVSRDRPLHVPQSVAHDTQQHTMPAVHDQPPHVLPHVPPHVSPHVPPHVLHHVPPHVQHHVPPHIQHHVPPHVQHHVPPHVQHHVPPHVQHHVPPHVPRHVHNDVPPLGRQAGPSHVSRHAPYPSHYAEAPQPPPPFRGAREDQSLHLMIEAAPWRLPRSVLGLHAQGFMAGEVQRDTTRNVLPEGRMNFHPDVRADTHHDARAYARHDARTDTHRKVQHHQHANIDHDVPTDVTPNDHAQVSHDVGAHIHHDVRKDVSAEYTDDVAAVRANSHQPSKKMRTVGSSYVIHDEDKSGEGSANAPDAAAAPDAFDGSDTPHEAADVSNHPEEAAEADDGPDEAADAPNKAAYADDESDRSDDDDDDDDMDTNENNTADPPADDDNRDGAASDSTDDAAEIAAIFGDKKAVGRISKASKAIIKMSFKDVIAIAKGVSQQTGLSVAQVYDQWDIKRTRHNVKTNKWNSFQVYYREHVAQERARLSKAVLEGATEADIPSLCYKKFKKKYGKKSDDILESYRQVRELSGAANTTVARRKQEWNSWCSDIKQQATVGHLKHGFSSIILAVGNVINSDGPLAMIHPSKDAEGFFPTRFRCTDDTAIGHMKALVYNNVSLAVVEMSQNDDDAVGLLAPGAAGPSNLTAAMADIPAGSPANVKVVNVSQAVFQRILQDIKLPDSRGRPQFVVSCMRGLLRAIGPQGAHIADVSNFQWKKFGAMLAAQGVVMVGYPEGVPMPSAAPVETQDDDAKAPARSKGVSGMGATPMLLFTDAFMRPHKTHPIGFQLYTGLHTDLLNSKVPVIVGVPPRPSSEFTHGRRFFMNGVTDQAGLKRRLPSADDSDDDAPVPSKKLVAIATPDSGDEADSEEAEQEAKSANTRASPRRTRSHTTQVQPDGIKVVDQAKVAHIAKAAGITLRTVAVEIPETPVKRKRPHVSEETITVSSGTGSVYSPSRSATPGVSESRGAMKRKADALESAAEESESLSEILAAARKIDKGKGRALDVETSDDEAAVTSRKDCNTPEDSAIFRRRPMKQRRLDHATSQDLAMSMPEAMRDVDPPPRQQAVHPLPMGSGGALPLDDVGSSRSVRPELPVAEMGSSHSRGLTHGVGQYIPPADSQHVHTNLGQYGRSDVGQYVPPADSQHVHTEVGQYGRSDIGQYGRSDVGQYGRSDVGQYVPPADGQHIHTGVGQYGRSDVGQYVPPADGQHIHTGVGQYGRSDVGHYVPPADGQHIHTGVGQYGRSDVGQYVPPADGQHIHTGVGQYGRSDVGQYVPPADGQHVRTEVGQYGRSDVEQYGRSDVGQYVPPADSQHGRTEVTQRIQPTVPNALPPFPPNLKPAHASTHINQQVQGEVFGYRQYIQATNSQNIRTNVGPPVQLANRQYVSTAFGQQVQPAGNRDVRTEGGQHIQPALGMSVSPNALPPFPPNLKPHTMGLASTHVDQQVPPEPHPHSHGCPDNADGRVVQGAPLVSMSGGDPSLSNSHPLSNGGASSYPGASYGTLGQAPYGPPFGSYPPQPTYPNPHYTDTAYQYSDGGGFHPAMPSGLPHPQHYIQPHSRPPAGSGASMSSAPAYQNAHTATAAGYPPGPHHAYPSPGAAQWPQQYQDGRQEQAMSTGSAQPAEFGNATRAG